MIYADGMHGRFRLGYGAQVIHVAAAMAEDRAEVDALVASGEDPNARDAGACTPLHYAAYNNPVGEVAAALFEAGAEPAPPPVRGGGTATDSGDGSELQCAPLAPGAFGSGDPLARPEDVGIGERAVGEAEPHGGRRAVGAGVDEVVHRPEDVEIFLHHVGVVGRIAVPDLLPGARWPYRSGAPAPRGTVASAGRHCPPGRARRPR